MIFTTVDPFYGSNYHSLGWVDYLCGGILIALALALIPLMIKANNSMNIYKSKQLELYKKNRKNSFATYKSSGLFVPMGKKFIYFLPVALFIVFMTIGITFLVGHPISQL